jgi:PAS domain S-box-containing protein
MIPALGLFTVAFVEVVLGALVLVRGPSRAVNRWFSGYAGALAAWGTVNGAFLLIENPPVNLILSRAAFAAAAVIAVTFYRFATVFPKAAPSGARLEQAVTLAGLFICGLAFSPWIVAEVRLQHDGFRLIYGRLHWLFALYFVTSYGWALAHLVRKLRRATGFARAQLQYLFLGTGLACVGAVTTNLAVPLIFGTSRFSRYGPYFTILVVAFTAHSIVRHRLLDIRVVVSRSAAYLAGWVLTAGFLVTATILLSAVLFGHDTPPVSDVLVGLVASVAFLFVAPYTRQLADRYLYRPAYDGRQLVRDGSRLMGTLADPDRVTTAMAELLNATLRMESLAILVRDRERETFHPRFARHVDATLVWPSRPVSTSSPLVRELRESPGSLLTDDLAHRIPSRVVAAIAGELRAWRAEVAVPVRREGELIAIMLGGAKLSGDPYFADDVDLLETMASQLAIGLKNGQLYQEIVSIKEYNERILARMDSGVVAVRDDGAVTTFNPAAERITGLTAGVVLGLTLQSLDPAMQGILKASLVGQPDAENEITIGHPDGRALPLLTHTSALHDANGHLRGAIVVFNDHSRLKALEEDKRRADRLAAMGALATGIAHEIRNPLVAIKTFAELLPERVDDPEFKSTFAKVAAKEIHRIEELLGRLRALAVPAVATLHPLELSGPIADTLDLLRGEADRRHVRVMSEIEPDLPAVLGEPDQLKQLFLNLLLNALDAMEGLPEGGTLSVTVRADRLRRGRSSKASGGFVTVRVTDTGPGIPRDDLPRIFEPFFTTKAQGTGLGLAISRGIADAHRARLWAEPGPAGVGTAFVIQFPALVGAPVVEALP